MVSLFLGSGTIRRHLLYKRVHLMEVLELILNFREHSVFLHVCHELWLELIVISTSIAFVEQNCSFVFF